MNYYISSACLNTPGLEKRLDIFAKNNFKSIELSGGFEFEYDVLQKLKILKKKHNFKYLIHNYFPPPKKNFVINLASSDSDLRRKSIEHCIKSINLCRELEIPLYSFHAGFCLDIKIKNLNNKILYGKYDRDKSKYFFFKSFEVLNKYSQDIEIYIENNVFNNLNLNQLSNLNPFLMSNSSEIIQFKKQIDFKLLLDIAHLYVSSKTLNLNFDDEIFNLKDFSDYLHISNNNGLHDQNLGLNKDCQILNSLSIFNFSLIKYITLEIYSGIKSICDSMSLLDSHILKK